jgi:ABC-type transport system involved in Fe-S cluster assembly fused permease/ATPase subunit
VESLGGGLDHALAEGGAPLSAGQKQLLALARAVLSPAKVGALGGRCRNRAHAAERFARARAPQSLVRD